MIGREHTLLFRFRIALLSVLALSLLICWPYVLKNHHHADFEETTHCAVCLFASTHVVSTPEPIDATFHPTLLGEIPTADEPVVASLPAHAPCGRAPPTA
jgi:hypothetical protein